MKDHHFRILEARWERLQPEPFELVDTDEHDDADDLLRFNPTGEVQTWERWTIELGVAIARELYAADLLVDVDDECDLPF